MGKIYNGISELIGNTPIAALSNFSAEYGVKEPLLAKLEYFNPAGSAKDRVAASMLNDAEERGLIKPGSTIIEPTSGNTGIGLAAIGTSKGYRVIIVMPETMSVERRSLIKAYGAELVLTDGAKGMTGAIEKAKQLAAEIENSLFTGQFTNPANVKAHYTTTGPEIWDAVDGRLDIFVAGIGTGGTISGAGKYLKEKNPAIKIIAVEPYDSPVLSGGKAGPHKIQGIGAGFVPEILDTGIYDEIITVKSQDAFDAGRRIAASEGLLVGISSGAALYAAARLAARPENEGKRILAFLPDTGERYLSTPMFS